MKSFKYKIPLLLSVAFVLLSFREQHLSKYTVLDEGYLRVSYSLEYLTNVEKPTDKWNDILFLDIGNNLSKCYSYAAYVVDSLVTEKALRGDFSPYRPANEAIGTEIFKHYSDEKITVLHRSVDFTAPVFLYDDEYCFFEWQISSDKKTILGYDCQKAITIYRGRTWEAWFTHDIPISEGPWLFCGLSGLILEVSDTQGHYIFKCAGLEKKQIPIVMYEWEYEKTTRKKINALNVRIHEDYAGYFESVGIRYIGKIPPGGKLVKPYNPIELE